MATALAVVAVASACGRSENVGWADRELPDTAGARSDLAGQQASRSAPSSSEELMQEYQRLTRSLAQVHMEAMADSELAARWAELNRDVEARIVQNSGFHRGLLERRAEIERIIEGRQQGSPEQELSDAEVAELARHYRNIQMEMARVRNLEFQKPEFSERASEFLEALYDRMREIAPGKAAELDRMLELETQLMAAAESTPPVPGMQPAPNKNVVPMVPPEEMERILGKPPAAGDTTGR